MTRKLQIITDRERNQEEWERTKSHVIAQIRKNGGYYIPASGGTETPIQTRSGATLLYCWNPVTGHHAYLNLDTDMILSNEEAMAHLNK